MEALVGFIVLLLVAYFVSQAAFQSGKRIGSRKGYGVGFDHGSRSRKQSGCLIIVVAFLVVGTTASLVLASLL